MRRPGGIPISGDQSRVSWNDLSETSGFTPQVASLIYIPNQTPVNYYFHYLPLPSPLPDDLSMVYPIGQLLRTGGRGLEKFIKKLLDHKGIPMQMTKASHDRGVDLYGMMDGKMTIIQCKNTPKVGIDTVQRTAAARDGHPAERAIIITTGEFTKDALEEAKKLDVECWDGKRLLEKIYKAQYFLPPE